MMQDGKAVQNATSHFLGTSFAGKFEVQFLDKDNQLKNPATTSWGCTTRMIGSLIMVHSDDLGLVLPPKIAPIQVVIVPVLLGQNNQKILDLSQKINTELLETCQSHLDSRDIRHGDKFYQWEKKGVPIRLELGPKDLENKQVTLVRRDTLAKETVSLENLNARILELLEQIQTNLFNCARDFRDQRMVEVDNWEDFAKEIESGKFVIASYDGTAKTEKQIKDKIKATTRCIPFDFKAEDIQEKCFFTGNKATTRAIFGKSY
jgi:prolyl-tRNA synthetase